MGGCTCKKEWEQASLVYMETSTNNARMYLPKSCNALEVCWEGVGLLNLYSMRAWQMTNLVVPQIM